MCVLLLSETGDGLPYIYKVENLINHKVYIGKTLYTIERRWYQHKQNTKRPYYQHMPLYAAINYYGIENFSITEVEYVENSDDLSEREKYWIAYYDSYAKGYNATLGGDGSLLYDYNMIWDYWENGLTIKEISKIMQCNDFTVRTVLSEHGVTTDERVERSFENQLNSHRPYQRIVEKIDPVSKDVIEKYESVSEAAAAINVDSSYFSKICRRYPQESPVRGYLWRYKDAGCIKKNYSPRKVCQIDIKTGEVLQIYNSIYEAAKAVNGDSSYISKVCRHVQKSSRGFAWEFLCEQ